MWEGTYEGRTPEESRLQRLKAGIWTAYQESSSSGFLPPECAAHRGDGVAVLERLVRADDRGGFELDGNALNFESEGR